MNIKIKTLVAGIFMAATMTLGSAQAALTIDDFTTGQSVLDLETTAGATNAAQSVNFTTTSLVGADRDLSAEAFANLGLAGTLGQQTATIGSGILSISNNSQTLGGHSHLLYTGFTAVDFTAAGTAIIMNVLGIDTGVSVEMIVNGTSTSGQVAFSGPGTFFQTFSQFSNPSAFTSVNSIELVFRGNEPWDGNFAFLRTDDTPTLPEPSGLILMGLGFAALSVLRKKK